MINKIKPLLIIFVLIWVIYLINLILPYELNKLGIIPRTLKGLRGIVCSPFLHGNFFHILSNSLPFLILGSTLFVFYTKNALNVFLLSILISGTLVWIFARPVAHIGMSGVIYAFATYLIFAGIFNKKFWAVVISILVVLFYGGLIWGLFPGNFYVSWEGHIAGAVAGFILAVAYNRKK